jgi:8-oxo-dGTP diphosphatase
MEFTKQRHIKTSVVACIVDHDERVLLTRRCIDPFCGQWVMPGGKIDHGESILEALHREVKEEVGIKVRAEELIDVFEHVGSEDKAHYIILYYHTTPLTFDLEPNGQECTEAVWVPKEQLPRFNLPPGTRHILSKVFPELAWGDAPPSDNAETEMPKGFEPPTI